MRIPKILLLGCVFAVLSLAIIQVSLNTYKNSSIAPGCSPQTSDGYPDPLDTVAYWDGRLINPVLPTLAQVEKTSSLVLGASDSNRWIEIDLSEQKIIAHDGDRIFLESPISSGLWNKTPVGEFSIWYKIVSTKMEGGVKGSRSYYYLPNVPFALFFKGSYGIHGTYWHNNFGTPRSHGCVNTPTPIAEKLFYWTGPVLPEGKRSIRADADNPGTRVVIHD